MYDDCHGCTDCADCFIWVVKPSNTIHVAHIEATNRPAHLVQGYAALERIICIWLVNNPVDLDTYWTVH
jgi:hypothetical protein